MIGNLARGWSWFMIDRARTVTSRMHAPSIPMELFEPSDNAFSLSGYGRERTFLLPLLQWLFLLKPNNPPLNQLPLQIPQPSTIPPRQLPLLD